MGPPVTRNSTVSAGSPSLTVSHTATTFQPRFSNTFTPSVCRSGVNEPGKEPPRANTASQFARLPATRASASRTASYLTHWKRPRVTSPTGTLAPFTSTAIRLLLSEKKTSSESPERRCASSLPGLRLFGSPIHCGFAETAVFRCLCSAPSPPPPCAEISSAGGSSTTGARGRSRVSSTLSQSEKMKTSLSMLSTMRRRPRRVARLKSFASGAKKANPAPGDPDDLLITNA